MIKINNFYYIEIICIILIVILLQKNQWKTKFFVFFCIIIKISIVLIISEQIIFNLTNNNNKIEFGQVPKNLVKLNSNFFPKKSLVNFFQYQKQKQVKINKYTIQYKYNWQNTFKAMLFGLLTNIKYFIYVDCCIACSLSMSCCFLYT